MRLIFGDSYGNERIIASSQNEKEAIKEIYKFCEDRNFKIYYHRTWVTNNRKCIDVGSWSEFFYIELEEGETWLD